MFDALERQELQKELERQERELNRQLFDHDVETADVYAKRAQQPEESARFGELLTDPVTGETRSYASLIDPALASVAQFEANLTHYGTRAQIRHMLADKIEREVVPVLPLPWVTKIPEKLRNARRTGTYGLHARSGRGIVLWDEKASLSRLCPDDAREEASRLQKRYAPMIEQAWREGCDVHYGVFTLPNFRRGELAQGMKKIFDRFKSLIKRKDKDGALMFPEIEGALCVLEAPLGRDRDWNVHLNVMLVVRGFLDWGKLRQAWHWNVEFKRLPRGNLERLQASFRELIKYAVQATSEKSEHHAARDLSRESSVEADPAPGCEPGAGEPSPDTSCPNRAVAPPMLAWTGSELAEWLEAMRGFRRSRSYGCLY
ncbi:MAG: hypothetical protein M3Y79_09255, partial [Pseudomonadota bacterium]|nr:hypothetical protein [Pseudomonadota bacterium]